MSIPEVISKNTPVTLQLGLLVTVIIGVFYLGGLVKDLTNERVQTSIALVEFKDALAEIKRELSNQWSYTMQREFATEFKERNPDVKIPVVSEIRERHSHYIYKSKTK